MKTVALNGRDIDRVLIWAGATLQAPHRAMAAQRGIAPYGVFVSFFFYGSPATHYGLYAGRRITEVDGQPTADLDAFIKAVSGKPDRASLRLKTVSWNGQTDVITLEARQALLAGVRTRSAERRQLDAHGARSAGGDGGVDSLIRPQMVGP